MLFDCRIYDPAISTVTFIAYFIFCIWEHFYPSLSFFEEFFLLQQKYNYREFTVSHHQAYTIGSKDSVVKDTASKS